MDDRPSLDELFVFADIDDVSEAPNGEIVLEFTMREQFGGQRITVSEETIEDALELARTSVRREIRLNMLKEEGLTLDDIDKLLAQEEAQDAVARAEYLAAERGGIEDYFADTEEIWQRGYDAARLDILERLDEIGVDPKVVFGHGPAVSEPVAAAAAEPVEPLQTGGVELLMQGHPLISVVYMPVAIAQQHSLGLAPNTRTVFDRD
jgi:hypothetical protein